ncbi:C40 family peptidase [Deinococcus hopiensis]|uniref:Cell wall-associated hydrolases (Invasion-associated proteins) n=1 Tax=Deinococcus hopiensis KR-140 TaxID=695939 RepID=A0A1W1VHG6_9DEIO|nr:NlpC/P60 family protein [Deinococcus hopiensis]SMB92501.1 Cell wall-associated hydrolases (invasion-associated proteins) [Deinococcus hopiensis KR-140]
MTAPPLDPRLHAFDSELRLADVSLQGRLPGEGWTYLTPQAGRAGNARLSLRSRPEADATQVTEALPGEALDVLRAREDGWAWVRTRRDGYPGWARAEGLTEARAAEEEVTVTALRAHAFAGPRVSRAIRAELCAGAALWRREGEAVLEDGRRWVPVTLPAGEDAWVQEVILFPVEVVDAAEYALRFLHTPYVWGGRSAWGLDCSGLSQLAYAALARAIPRDADQQQAALTPVVEPRRGDLAFFPGHVGVMLSAREVVHANATHMRVTVETFGEGDYGQRLAASCTGFGRWTP